MRVEERSDPGGGKATERGHERQRDEEMKTKDIRVDQEILIERHRIHWASMDGLEWTWDMRHGMEWDGHRLGMEKIHGHRRQWKKYGACASKCGEHMHGRQMT